MFIRKYIKHLIESIEGGSPRESYRNKMFVFDVDETLFKTYAKILVVNKRDSDKNIVVKDGKNVVRELSNQEFNSYKLGPGEEFSFEQFKDMDFFRETSEPIRNVLDLLKDLKSEGQVCLMTARMLPKDLNGFFDAFADYYGTREVMQDVVVAMVGGAENKKAKFANWIDRFKPDYIEFYDDHRQNLEDLQELEEDGIKIRTFEVVHGEIREYP